MAYTNSSLVAHVNLSPNHSGQRTHNIDRITPHCVVGQCSAEGLGDWFAKTSTKASSNYGVDKDGRVGLYVEEKNRSWCSSSNANDQRAVTIECASDTLEPYSFRDVVYQKLIVLCVDICNRNGKKKLLWFGDKEKALNYAPKADEMVLTVHRWFANKSCPGDWLYGRLGDLAAKVTAQLGGTAADSGGTLYRVQTGAFSKKSNADALEEKLKAKDFDTYMMQSGGLYKVQVGAYSVRANAETMMEKVKEAGFDAFITTVSGSAVSSSNTNNTKSIDTLAREVIRGDWGNGAERKGCPPQDMTMRRCSRE